MSRRAALLRSLRLVSHQHRVCGLWGLWGLWGPRSCKTGCGCVCVCVRGAPPSRNGPPAPVPRPNTACLACPPAVLRTTAANPTTIPAIPSSRPPHRRRSHPNPPTSSPLTFSTRPHELPIWICMRPRWLLTLPVGEVRVCVCVKKSTRKTWCV